MKSRQYLFNEYHILRGYDEYGDRIEYVLVEEAEEVDKGAVMLTRGEVLAALNNHSDPYCWDDLDINAAMAELFGPEKP